jgi:hypothetical protein
MVKLKILISIFLALTLTAFVVFVYTPHLIFFAQPEYFENDFISLVLNNFLRSLLVFFIFVAFCSFFSVKILSAFASVLFVFSVLVWLQADIFALSYGVLDGSDIDFSIYQKRGYWEWGVLLASLFLAFIFRSWLNKNSKLISSIILLSLLVTVSIKYINTPVEIVDQEFDQEFNYYSSAKNVIVIVLDGFGAEYFEEAIKDNPALKSKLNGFVHYRDAISNYAATVGSVPSMLVGRMFPKDVKYKQFIKEDVAKEGMQKVFESRGYEVSVISPSLNFRNIYPRRFLPNVAADSKVIKEYNSLKLLDYALFRVSPHNFKPEIYNDGQWWLSKQKSVQSQLPNTYSERGKAFLDYVKSKAVVVDEKPRFKLIHATIPHPEFVYDENCEGIKYPKGTRGHIKMIAQSKCALELLTDLLAKYKELDIYDKSLIVVTSDHGARVYDSPEVTGFPSDFELSASGILFMIKGVDQTLPFRSVEQPFSLLKLKENLVNKSLHASDYSEMRDENRLFYAYQPIQKSAKGYLNDAPIYKVEKNYKDPKSWNFLDFFTNNCKKQQPPIEMVFSRSNRSGYCGAFGFQQFGKNFKGIWTKFEENFIVFGFHKQPSKNSTTNSLELSLEPRLDYDGDEVLFELFLNKHLIGETVLSQSGIQSLYYEFDSSLLVEGENELKISLPQVKSGKEKGVNNNRMKLGVQIEKIVIR